MYSVYVLCDPRTGETRYVGCSMNIKLRYLHHVSHRDTSNQAKQAWIDELKEQGLRPWLIIIEEGLEKARGLAQEKYWIQKCLEEGTNLTNIRDADLLPWECRVSSITRNRIAQIRHLVEGLAKQNSHKKGWLGIAPSYLCTEMKIGYEEAATILRDLEQIGFIYDNGKGNHFTLPDGRIYATRYSLR